MRLLHVISSAATTGGGPIEAVRLLAEYHARTGHESEVATLDDPDTGARSGFPAPLHACGPGRGKYGYAPRLLAWLRSSHTRFDAVLAHGLWQYHDLAVWQALHTTQTPYLVYPHGMLDPWFKRQFPLKHLKKWLYWPWADYRVLRDAAAVLFTCEEEMRLAPHSFPLYRANAMVTGLGTAAPALDLPAAAARFLHRRPDLQGRHILLFLGRLHPKKGCDLLLDAFARTLAGHNDWRLVMAGPDQLGWQAALQVRAAALGIADRVSWPGMLTGEEKWGALAAAEVFVLPSHQENFGIAVAEALACGTPVLLSNQVNIWREVEACGAGLAAADTADDVAGLLQQWDALPAEDRSMFRVRAQQCFRRHFDMESSAARVLAVVAEVKRRREQKRV